MADPEKQESPATGDEGQQTSGGTAGGEIGLNMAYVTSIPGILKIVEFFTLMIAFSVAADSILFSSWGRMDFFLFVTVTSWLVVIAAFVLFAFNVIAKINVTWDWNIPVLGFAVIAAILLLLCSSLLANDVSRFSGFNHTYLDKLRAAAGFGFISMFVFIGDAVVHFMKMQGRM